MLDLLLPFRKVTVLGDDNALGINGGDLAVRLGDDHGTGISGDAALHSGSDDRGVGDEERHALALHIRAHERAVRVVVLEERNEAGGHRDKLLGRDVHILDLIGLDLDEVAAETRRDGLPKKLALAVDGRVRLRHVEVLVTVAGEVLDLVGDLAVHDLAVRGLDEAEVVDAGVGGERADQTDVGTFRGLDRADTAVVGGMDVADLESGALAGETPWPEGRETALVCQFGERVRLIHELAQLRTAEEITHDGAQRLGVDQLLRGDVIDCGIVEGHALANETLGAGETDAALVGKKFAHSADTAAAEMINVVQHPLALAELEEIAHRLDDIFFPKDPVVDLRIEAELLLDLVATDATEIVTLGVEEEPLEHAAGILDGGRIAGTELAVDVLEGLFLVVGGVALEGLDYRVVLLGIDHLDAGVAGAGEVADDGRSEGLVGTGDNGIALADIRKEYFGAQSLLIGLVAEPECLDLVKERGYLLVGRESEGAEEGGGKELATALAAVEIDVEEIVRVELHLGPGTAVGNDAESMEELAVEMHIALEADAGGAVKLADNDALGTVDYEGARIGHERNLAHVDLLLFGGLLILVTESDVKGGAVGLTVDRALGGAHLGLLERVAHEVEGGLLLKTVDREKLAEDGLKADVLALGGLDARLEKFLVRLDLQFDEVGRLDRLVQFSEGDTVRHGAGSGWSRVWFAWVSQVMPLRRPLPPGVDP